MDLRVEGKKPQNLLPILLTPLSPNTWLNSEALKIGHRGLSDPWSHMQPVGLMEGAGPTSKFRCMEPFWGHVPVVEEQITLIPMAQKPTVFNAAATYPISSSRVWPVGSSTVCLWPEKSNDFDTPTVIEN